MGTDDERHIGMTGISDPRAMSTTGCERGRGKEKRRPAELPARRTATPYPAYRHPYRLEHIEERRIFPQVDVDAWVFGGNVE